MVPGAKTVRIAYYGDDFTGASDTLATATQGGLRTLLFLRVPTRGMLDAVGYLDCIGIAGASRSMAAAELENELHPVAEFFARLGVPVIHYKTCSTFDSSPTIGNIALAVQHLSKAAPGRYVPIVGGQPNIGRYCAFGNLFAAAETGGPVFRIDRHPTMSHHPVTPMTESDLRLHLGRQGLNDVKSIPYPAYEMPADVFGQRIEQAISEGSKALLFDVTRIADLAPIGREIWREAQRERLVAAGPSGVTQALCAHWHETGELTAFEGTARVAAADGPVFVMAGSLSPVTRRQIELATDFVRVSIDALRLSCGDANYVTACVREVSAILKSGRSVIAHTTPLDEGQYPAEEVSRIALAKKTGEFVAELLSGVCVHRLGVAGGDTSSWTLRALDVWGLSFAGHLSPGVALCRAHSNEAHLDGLEVMLKGGQMGAPDLFRLLLQGN